MTPPAGSGQDPGAASAVAPAKINLFLLIGEKRADGYHPVCSLMEKVTLNDAISIRRTGRPGVRLLGTSIPAPQNTVFRAAAALEQEAGIELDIEVTLEKRIPEAAGLAGGSSDAAAVLRLLDRMYSLSLPPDRLKRLALGIGADVPFFLEPGPQLAEGTGELLASPGELPWYHAVIVKPEAGLSTAEVYELYDAVSPDHAAAFPRRRQELLAALAKVGGSSEALASILVNDLELPAQRLFPELPQIKRELESLGAAGALMSGSGTSVFAVFAGEKEASTAFERLEGTYAGAWLVHPARGKGE
ncbi:MAG: 4-(cytidine 5'-diphospho)-2-C-methyl-D-erythritol kinase [Gaiellales bacterium]|nr:MAG: 4-(cytidine 5'-diphospho)-2-C-methyl-D-erythritol kinase [Gaiellales bacterium]